uniref:PID domain-containing protein n=1 Tax=Acrobeloides nanus TaxID=290746 RepID=A0A914CBF2_9BILA
MPLEIPDQPQPSTSGGEVSKKKVSAAPIPSSSEEDDVRLSEQQRFYYLRLMAKPGKRPEPIKMKFVRWAPPLEKNLSVDDEGTLESQAMRVVRTIGQAFEVCHKMAQDQMQEKQQLEDAEANNNIRNRVSGSAISEEDLQQLQALAAEERAAAEGPSKSPSPVAPPPPPPPAPSSGKRHSIFMPRRFSSDVSSQGTAIDTSAMASTSANNPAITSYPVEQQPSTSQGLLQQGIPVGTNPHNPAFQPNIFPTGSSTLPHSHTWNPGHPTQLPGNFPSLQSLEAAQTAQTTYPFYPYNPMIAQSSSMPYGLSSQTMVSPYATLQLPSHSQALTGTTEQNVQQPSTSSMHPNPSDSAANLSAALQFSRSLDQYNQQVIRAQLEQAQQAAQVASCQVQLLRDQLTSETTARIEAQSRTHQLLNTNRELLEQVTSLVSRLQHLETKLSTEIHSVGQPGQTRSKLPTEAPPLQTSSVPHIPSTSASAFMPMSYHEQLAEKPARKFSEGQSLVKAMRPYQIQTLADLRSGSLPPSGEEGIDANSPKKKRRPIDDSGTRTEPETEDTTDYSSSDQYEKTGISRAEEKDDTIPHYSILLSNPQTLGDLSSFFQPYNMPQVPQAMPRLTTIPQAMPGIIRPVATQPMLPQQQQLPQQPFILQQQQLPQQPFNLQQPQQSPPQAITIQQQQMPPVSVQQQFQQQLLATEEEKLEQPGPSGQVESPKKRKSGLKMGVLKEREFTRMSFNSRLNRGEKRGSLSSSSTNAPSTSAAVADMIETIPEETREETQRRRSSVASVEHQHQPSTSTTITRPIILPSKFELPSTSKMANPPAPLVITKLTQGSPASANIATAMYPPVKTGFAAPLNKILPDSKKFRTLSVDLDKNPLRSNAPAPENIEASTSAQPVGKPPTIPMISAAIERLSNRSGPIASNVNNNTILNANPGSPPLRYVPERSRGDGSADMNTANLLNNNRPEAARGFIDPDSVRGRTLQALDSQKLSDPSVLARLTRNITGGKDGTFQQLPNGLP